MVNVIRHEKFEGVYICQTDDGSERLCTKNLAPGRSVYGERLFQFKSEEYREWNSYRSKLAASILNGIKEVPIVSGTKVLYLGAASGTTASHVSDIVGNNGIVYAVEFSPRVVRELILTAQPRNNLFPILADARQPHKYRFFLEEVDVIYADIAQPNQAEIVIANAKFYLKRKGHVLMAIKARSIDVTKQPEKIFEKEIKTLEENNFEVIETVNLSPYDKDHQMVLAVYKE
jgi:fibrillarin-like pre-rRNA processing protein